MSFASHPLVVDTKANLVRQRLAEAIINGELRPGDRLVLDEIARDLGISKIPLREALSGLEAAGLVVTSPHAGPRVAPLPFHEIRGIYLLREQVETLGMQLAVTHIDDAVVEDLRQINEEMRTGLRESDVVAMSDLNARFHLAIARASSYDTIVESVAELLIKVRRYRAVINGLAANWTRAVAEHDDIIDALASGDAARAIDTMRSHVHNQGQLEAAEELIRAESDDA
ncbi:GntR family transcriptional regulator [Microbacterium sp. RU33B]|uniref:GntR family transcriptional regulator n=1 Tax=Microbacterium sp. RU33B TaxID=1907390 RepID=UPI00095F6814|nr:GntR family transcriptional regulator [Microbacterium sp. RU33B]SIT89763.1 DNA-binding transcriptional regulator, GntR family [Microbacterium sp. RU33B]